MSTTVIRRTVRPDYCSVTDAATLLAVDPSSVRHWIRTGRLPARRTPGGGVRVPLIALENLPEYVNADRD